MLAEGRLGEDWGGGWNGNALVSYYRESLVAKANQWADDEGLEPQQRTQLLQWIGELPWRGDDIMLHLDW